MHNQMGATWPFKLFAPIKHFCFRKIIFVLVGIELKKKIFKSEIRNFYQVGVSFGGPYLCLDWKWTIFKNNPKLEIIFMPENGNYPKFDYKLLMYSPSQLEPIAKSFLTQIKIFLFFSMTR